MKLFLRNPESRKERSRAACVIAVLAVVLFLLIVLSFQFGRYSISPKELAGIIFSRIKILHIEPFWTDRMESIFFQARLPRILLACMVGCSLSAAGASYQGVFQNPMAAPDVLGASSGAAFGAALAILKYGTGWRVTVSAFLFSLLSVSLVYLISRRAGGNKILVLVLSGIVISSLFQAGTSFIKLVADPDNQLPAITFWLMGSLRNATPESVKFAAIPMAAGLLPLFLLRWRINVLTLGDEEATAIGVNADRLRLFIIIAATLITAASVSVSGMIGWVGLVIPHFARRLTGSNYQHLMPATMLLGASFMLLVDDIARNLLVTEIPLGILTAVIGAPFFIFLILRERSN